MTETTLEEEFGWNFKLVREFSCKILQTSTRHPDEGNFNPSLISYSVSHSALC